jgi:Chitinase
MKKTALLSYCAVLLAAGICTACGTTGNVAAGSSGTMPKYSVSSYIRTWPLGSTLEDQKSNTHWSAKNLKGDSMTDLIIAFAQAKADGTIYFPDVESPDHPFPGMWKEVQKVQKKYPHLKINVSIGGWGADQFSPVAADPAKRAVFVQSIMDMVKAHNLDGIDIDWEYPVGPDWGEDIPHSPDDGKNFVTMLSEIRAGFNKLDPNKKYKISIAAPGSSWYTQKLDVKALAAVVDTFKLMTYDYYGPWSSTTGHHANLYNNPSDPAWGGWSTAQTVDAFLAAGVPASQLVIGVAFYGRAWKGVPDAGVHGLFQKYKENAFPDGLSWPDLKKLLDPGSGYTRYWDDVAKAPFLYNGDVFITYTDQQEIAEIGAYVKQKGLGGVMTWEYGHDVNAELLGPLYKSVN